MPVPMMQVVGGGGDDEETGIDMEVKMMRRDRTESAAAMAGICFPVVVCE